MIMLLLLLLVLVLVLVLFLVLVLLLLLRKLISTGVRPELFNKLERKNGGGFLSLQG